MLGEGGDAPAPRRSLRTVVGFTGFVLALCVMVAIAVSMSPSAVHAAKHLLPDSDAVQTLLEPRDHPEKPAKWWGALAAPYPTGAWWLNLVVGDGDEQVVQVPYAYKATEGGLEVSYSAWRRVLSGAAVADIFGADWTIGALADTLDRYLVRHDLLTVHAYFVAAQSGSYKALLARGSPYTTVEYSRATPTLRALGGLSSVNDRSVAKDSSSQSQVHGKVLVTGTRFVLLTGSGQKWLLYASKPIAFNADGDGLEAVETFTGTLRLAILPANCAAGAEHLDHHAPVVPLAAQVSYRATGSESGDVSSRADILYRFSTETWENWAPLPTPAATGGAGPTLTRSTGPPSLLTLLLPHHVDSLVNSAGNVVSGFCGEAPASFESLKGPLTPVKGSEWQLHEKLPHTHWFSPPPAGASALRGSPASGPSAKHVEAIVAALQEDVYAVPPTAKDSYGFGKEVSRMAQLALVAEAVGARDLALVAQQKVKDALEPWLEGSTENALLYDRTYGGVVTSDGLADKESDFGNGWYNDHHFHYGYFIYAAAVAARSDPVWARRWGSRVMMLVRDIAGNLPDEKSTADAARAPQPAADPLFPVARHKDWYDGHSWASGLAAQANGKGQESSSEACNAYYAVALYGLAIGSAELHDYGRILLATEKRSAQAYYHMPRNTPMYDVAFASNRMVGNLGAADATASTWFGSEVEYFHGIQVMPVTPFTEELFDEEFVAQEFPLLATALAREENPPQEPWKGVIYQVQAIVQPEEAWENLVQHEDFGSGGAKALALYWAATRPAPRRAFDLDAERQANEEADEDVQKCSAISGCRVLGLDGNCCPSGDGDDLGCCPVKSKAG